MFHKINSRIVLFAALLCLVALPLSAQQTTDASSPDSPSAPQSQSSTSAETSQDQPAKEQAAQDQPVQTKPSAASGQKPSSSADSSKPQNPSIQEAPLAGKGKVEGTSNDRLFYALPNFLSVESVGQLPPLTTKQKFTVVAQGSFDWVVIPWYGFLASLGQAQNSEPGYGQGWEAYGKRFATNFADGTIENFITGAILPSMLKQDPRFYQSGKGSFPRRAFYAASRNVITYSDSGKKEFNYSEVVGGALSAAISTYSYHPRSTYISTPTDPHKFIPSDRTLKNTASVWASQFGYDTMTIVLKEFWPDIHRKLSKKTKSTATTAEAGVSR